MDRAVRTSGGGIPYSSSWSSVLPPCRKAVLISPEATGKCFLAAHVNNMFRPRVESVGDSLGKWRSLGSWKPLMINRAFARFPVSLPALSVTTFQVYIQRICIMRSSGMPAAEQIWTASLERKESISFFMASSNCCCSWGRSFLKTTSAPFLAFALITQALFCRWTSRGASTNSIWITSSSWT